MTPAASPALAAGAPATPSYGEPAPARPRRIASLDAARGVMLTLSVTAEAVLAPRPPAFVHTKWTGLHYYDWIFPLFVTLAGCGMAFAFRSGVNWRRNARRILVLIAAGLAYNWVLAPDRGLADLRFTGVLQVYAALVLLVALLHHWLRSARAWALFTLGWSVALTLFWWAVSRDCAGGFPQPRCNPTLALDSAWLGGTNHLYRLGERGFETEGLLGILGALVICSAGVTAGHLLRSTTGRNRPLAVLAWAGACAVSGAVLWQVIPGLKWLWTPSYGLVTATAGLVLLVLCYLLVDTAPMQRVGMPASFPWRALGRNSLLVYFGSHVLQTVLLRVGDPAIPFRIRDHLAWTGHPNLAWVLASLLLWWVVALLLNRARIYVRA